MDDGAIARSGDSGVDVAASRPAKEEGRDRDESARSEERSLVADLKRIIAPLPPAGTDITSRAERIIMIRERTAEVEYYAWLGCGLIIGLALLKAFLGRR